MVDAVLAARDKQIFTHLAQELGRYPVDIHWTEDGKSVLEILSRAKDQGRTVDLVITDETLPDMSGKRLVEQVTMKSPMTSCAAASALSPDRFHDFYEGLGVLMQLPLEPDAESGKELVRILQKLNILT